LAGEEEVALVPEERFWGLRAEEGVIVAALRVSDVGRSGASAMDFAGISAFLSCDIHPVICATGISYSEGAAGSAIAVRGGENPHYAGHRSYAIRAPTICGHTGKGRISANADSSPAIGGCTDTSHGRATPPAACAPHRWPITASYLPIYSYPARGGLYRDLSVIKSGSGVLPDPMAPIAG
jgi:hypothetical protein